MTLDEQASVSRMRPTENVGGFDWSAVDDVLLDMDGTLLDRHFDNFFFEEGLPRRYAKQQGLEFTQAQAQLRAMYRAVEGELEWADLTYWSKTLGLDVVALTREFDHLMAFLPDAIEFLRDLRRRGKCITVVTNAHPINLEIKTAKTGLDQYVDRIVHAFEVGCLKMRPDFWPACRRLVNFTPSRTLYIDDDEACLSAARQYGMAFVYHSSRSSSRLPPAPSCRFPSIETFQDLLAR